MNIQRIKFLRGKLRDTIRKPAFSKELNQFDENIKQQSKSVQQNSKEDITKDGYHHHERTRFGIENYGKESGMATDHPWESLRSAPNQQPGSDVAKFSEYQVTPFAKQREDQDLWWQEHLETDPDAAKRNSSEFSKHKYLRRQHHAEKHHENISSSHRMTQKQNNDEGFNQNSSSFASYTPESEEKEFARAFGEALRRKQELSMETTSNISQTSSNPQISMSSQNSHQNLHQGSNFSDEPIPQNSSIPPTATSRSEQFQRQEQMQQHTNKNNREENRQPNQQDQNRQNRRDPTPATDQSNMA